MCVNGEWFLYYVNALWVVVETRKALYKNTFIYIYTSSGINPYLSAFQNKADVQEKEVKKFDGTGYDKDLVEALERDIISENPNVKWYVFIRFYSSELWV